MIPGDFRLPKRPDKKRLALAGFVGLFGLAGFIGTVLVATFVISAWFGRPIVFGYDEGPTQPIAFPHTVHAGLAPLLNVDGTPRVDEQGEPLNGLGLDCTFCHRNVTKEAAATIPAVGLCMSCHTTVGDGNPEVEKLRAISDAGLPIDWIRVHRVPDHVHFVHEAHIRFFTAKDNIPASQVCTICHGEVASMTKVRHEKSLKMGDCVDCHRDNGAPTDCTTCHY